jgi:hypothetical protein
MTAGERETLRVLVDRRRRRTLHLAPPPKTAEQLALGKCGPAAVARLEEAYRRLGRATLLEAARVGRVGTGTSTHASRVLVERGVIRPTGRRVKHSPEYELAG